MCDSYVRINGYWWALFELLIVCGNGIYHWSFLYNVPPSFFPFRQLGEFKIKVQIKLTIKVYLFNFHISLLIFMEKILNTHKQCPKDKAMLPILGQGGIKESSAHWWLYRKNNFSFYTKVGKCVVCSYILTSHSNSNDPKLGPSRTIFLSSVNPTV